MGAFQRTSLRRLAVAATCSLIGWTAHSLADDSTADNQDEPRIVETGQSGLGLTYVSSPRGVMVAEVREEGPADKAGIQAGDRIVSIAGESIRTAQSAIATMRELAPGSEVLVEFTRGRERLEVAVTVDDVPDAVRRREEDNRSDDADEPMRFEADASVEREVNLGWELATTADGVRVERLEAGGPAGKAHLEEGDIIVSIAGENVLTPEAVHRALNQLDGGTQVEVTVSREGEKVTYLLKLPRDHERDLNRDPNEPQSRVQRETTRRRIDLGQFRESNYENTDDRRLLIEILRELAYQRQLLESMAGSSQYSAPASGAIIPGQATPSQPRPGRSESPGDENPDRVRDQRRTGSVPDPPVAVPLEGRQRNPGQSPMPQRGDSP